MENITESNNYFCPEGPHERCNYIDNNYGILIGAEPRQQDIEKILNSGFTIFISLIGVPKYVLPNYATLYIFNIPSGGVPSDDELMQILYFVDNNKDKKIYIHCNGGHGRVSVIGSILVGKKYSWDAAYSIYHIENCRNSRTDKSRNFIPVPETNKQVDFIRDKLGLREGNFLPDRSDRSWLKRVKNERSKR